MLKLSGAWKTEGLVGVAIRALFAWDLAIPPYSEVMHQYHVFFASLGWAMPHRFDKLPWRKVAMMHDVVNDHPGAKIHHIRTGNEEISGIRMHPPLRFTELTVVLACGSEDNPMIAQMLLE
jgi:hypothetical protein